MTENSYVLGRELSALTEAERQAHLERVCEAADLDPKLGLIRYTWMNRNDGSGEKHLVLYATKGATNKIRDIRGIDVVELTDKIVAGAYVVTAKVKNAKGRIDMATGAAAIEGKRGKHLEDAFALAQTRASRRATLQMSGLDLLDESEVFDTDKAVASVDNPPALPTVSQPANPSSEVGVDITAAPGLTLKASAGAQADAPSPVAVIGSDRIPNPAAGLKLTVTNIEGPGLSRANLTADKTKIGDTVAVISAEEPKQRRKRRTKAEMEAGRAVPNEQAAAAPASISTPAASPEVVEPAPSTETITTAAKVVGDLPNADQMKVYVERLGEYRTEILPKGGMIPSHGMGVNRKIRAFFSVANNNQEDLTKLTVGQWDNTFSYMDKIVKEQGANELVRTIEFNIGASDDTAT